MKRGRLKILLFKFAIFDLNLAVFVFLLFKGCVQFVRVCFLKVATFASSPSVILQRKFLFKLEEFANLQPKKLRTCLALKHAAVIDYISVPRFLSCFGRFSRIVKTFMTSLLISAWYNFYHLAINYCMVQLFCFTVLQISPSTTSAYKVPYFLE